MSDAMSDAMPAMKPVMAPVERPTYTSQGPLPKWAAVAPAHASLETQAAPVQPARSGQPARPAAAAGSGHAAAPAAPYNAHDFAPLPELGTGQKILFYVLSFLVPLLGLLLFAAYRTKPAAPDRAAARIFLVLGVISVILYGLCGILLLMTEAFLLTAGT